MAAPSITYYSPGLVGLSRRYLLPNSLFRSPIGLCSSCGKFSRDPNRAQLAQLQFAGCLAIFSSTARLLFLAGLIFLLFKKRSVQS
jgi:hypothetical protein